MHASGHSIHDARDAAVALRPLAGGLASGLFGAGLVGAALLAAAILPLSTAYSVGEALGYETALDDKLREAPVFYGAYAVVVVLAGALVLLPGAPLIPILFLTQALNAILLLPLLVFAYAVSRDTEIMGDYVSGPVGRAATLLVIAALAVCVGALLVFSIMG